MKNLITAVMLMISINSYCQLTTADKQTYAVAGFSAGYSKYVTAGLQFGVRTGNIYISIDQLISVTSNATTPKIFKANAGYNFGSLQPFVSYSYQTIGAESEQYYKGTPDEFINGFRVGYGLSYYFKNFPLSITAQRQGKVNNINVGMYKAL